MLFFLFKPPSTKASAGDTRMSYLIIYYIRRPDNATRLRVNRRLRKLGALKLQHSVWELNGLWHLRALANSIKSTGGKAIVVKKRVVYK